ncbi:ATP-binding cassette domain-containing protein [Bradyrhizobium ottawaense]|uniref:ATP-binding cassette domain-containing protein n=1 Tax=Bradyrhizobium ottawaense TaxID=931866 RepID=UPI00385115F9
MPDDALLEVDDLCVAYDGSNALNGVSLRIGKGELICVVGANGAGKTSLIRSIAGIVPSSRGSVRINGVEISRLPPWGHLRNGHRSGRRGPPDFQCALRRGQSADRRLAEAGQARPGKYA